MYVQIKHFLK